MELNLLADESINYRIVKTLRQAGFPVAAIIEDCPGSLDTEVLELSVTQEAILLTEDSDFGEWVFAHRADSRGVIFFTLLGIGRIVDNSSTYPDTPDSSSVPVPQICSNH